MTRAKPSKRTSRDHHEHPPVQVAVAPGAPQPAGRSACVVPCAFTVAPQIAASESARSRVCLVFDCSTSMRGERIQLAIDAANLIVDHLHLRHRLSLVTFSSASRLLLDNVAPTDSRRPKMKQQIEALRSEVGGKTRLSLGIRRAMRTFRSGRPRDGYANTMIILSDGGADRPGEAFKAARQAADAGTQIFAVGVGEAYRADQLLKLVKPAAGTVLDHRESDGLSAAFRAILGRIESFVATNARLELHLDQGVRPGTGYRTSPEAASLGPMSAPRGKLSVNLGHLEPSERYGLLIELKSRRRTPGRLATAVFTCDIPNLAVRGYRRELEVRADLGPAAQAQPERARQSARIADAADALAQASRADAQREALERLAAAGAEAHNERLQARSQELLAELNEHGQLTNAALNTALIVASHARTRDQDRTPPAKRGAKLYDVVLMDAGATPIRVLRELRSATGRPLAELGRLLRVDQPVIGQAVRHRDARDLQRRVKAVGAKAVIHPTRTA